MTKSKQNTPTVDPHILTLLMCPVSQTPLTYDAEKQELLSPVAKLAYPIRHGIPIMVKEEARPLTEKDLTWPNNKHTNQPKYG